MGLLFQMYAKNRIIYTPDDWHTIIVQYRKRNKLMLKKMTRDDFKSVANLEHLTSIPRRKKTRTITPLTG